MPRNSHAFHPVASHLESRSLLSSMRGPAEFAPFLAAGPRGVNTLAGQYVAVDVPRLWDIGTHVDLDGRGLVRGLGPTRLSGSLELGGYTGSNQDILGSATLSTPRGTMTVRLSGSTLSGGGDSQVFGSTFELRAVVESGTGAYKDVRRVGTATVSFGSGRTVKGVPVSPSDPLWQLARRVDVTNGSLTVKLDLPPLR